MQALERREVVVSQLVDALGRGQVLQPVLAEVAQAVGARERRRWRPRQHLPAVAAGGDARRPVDVDPHVAFLGHVRRARVEAHADADRARGEPLQRGCRRRERTRRRRERDEESVALRIHLDPAVRNERLAQDPAMLGERSA